MQAGSWSARQFTYRRQVYLSPYACLFKMTTNVTIKWNSLGSEVAAVAVLCSCSYFLLQFSRIWCFSHRVSYNRTMKIRWSPGTLARQCPEDASAADATASVCSQAASASASQRPAEAVYLQRHGTDSCDVSKLLEDGTSRVYDTTLHRCPWFYHLLSLSYLTSSYMVSCPISSFIEGHRVTEANLRGFTGSNLPIEWFTNIKA